MDQPEYTSKPVAFLPPHELHGHYASTPSSKMIRMANAIDALSILDHGDQYTLTFPCNTALDPEFSRQFPDDDLPTLEATFTRVPSAALVSVYYSTPRKGRHSGYRVTKWEQTETVDLPREFVYSAFLNPLLGHDVDGSQAGPFLEFEVSSESSAPILGRDLLDLVASGGWVSIGADSLVSPEGSDAAIAAIALAIDRHRAQEPHVLDESWHHSIVARMTDSIADRVALRSNERAPWPSLGRVQLQQQLREQYGMFDMKSERCGQLACALIARLEGVQDWRPSAILREHPQTTISVLDMQGILQIRGLRYVLQSAERVTGTALGPMVTIQSVGTEMMHAGVAIPASGGFVCWAPGEGVKTMSAESLALRIQDGFLLSSAGGSNVILQAWLFLLGVLGIASLIALYFRWRRRRAAADCAVVVAMLAVCHGTLPGCGPPRQQESSTSTLGIDEQGRDSPPVVVQVDFKRTATLALDFESPFDRPTVVTEVDLPCSCLRLESYASELGEDGRGRIELSAFGAAPGKYKYVAAIRLSDGSAESTIHRRIIVEVSNRIYIDPPQQVVAWPSESEAQTFRVQVVGASGRQFEAGDLHWDCAFPGLELITIGLTESTLRAARELSTYEFTCRWEWSAEPARYGIALGSFSILSDAEDGANIEASRVEPCRFALQVLDRRRAQ